VNISLLNETSEMMNISLRRTLVGEEFHLWEVFQSSVHGVAKQHYTPEQLNAWAPPVYPGAAWYERIRQNKPFVAVRHDQVLGYADIQADGYIDQFFVAESAARQGVGSLLMNALLQEAVHMGVTCLHSKVSLSAQAFFRRFGFLVEAEEEVQRHGIRLSNARMVRDLTLFA
jgi:putative acetyltransferase